MQSTSRLFLAISALLFIISTIEHFQTLFHTSNHHVPRHPSSTLMFSRLFPTPPSNDVGPKFSVVMPTIPRRFAALNITLRHYASCGLVDRVVVIVDSPEAINITPPNFDSMLVLVHHAHRPDNMNNRFNLTGLQTSEALFSVDDDLTIDCNDLEFAFSVFRRATHRMVGFEPRLIELKFNWLEWFLSWFTGLEASPHSLGQSGAYSPRRVDVLKAQAVSVVLTRCAFVHRHYFDLYTKPELEQVHDLVTKCHNCEDIAMAFIVGGATNQGPIWVKSQINELPQHQNGISKLKTHKQTRTNCIRALIEMFGGNVLKATHTVLSLA